MMNPDENSKLETLVNKALDDSIDELSPEVQRRLTNITMDAARRKNDSNPFQFTPAWKMATAFSVVLAVSLSWRLWPTIDELPYTEVAELSPFAEVLQEDLDMLEELDFVYWMAEESESETATL